MDEIKEDWFTNVENLKPVRGGRRAATLDSVAKNEFHISDKKAEETFRTIWDIAKEADDPLDILWQYSIWFDEHFPSGKPKLFYPMLYKICTTYGSDSRYEFDERLLKFWILLAENFPERGLAVFEFAYSRGSCKSMAKFYVRWSEMYDTLGNARKARDTLELAFQNRSTPVTLIHEARQKLEMRLLRDTLKKQQEMSLSDHEEQEMEQDDSSHDYGSATNAPRKKLAKLTGVGEKSEAPMFRVPKGSPGILKLPQVSKNASFEIYQDVIEFPSTSAAENQVKTKHIADEFANDPDYQALFGYFNQHSRSDIHMNISENVHKKANKNFGLKDLPEIEPGDDFEIFTDEIEKPTRSAPLMENVLSSKKKEESKPRLCSQKSICRDELSIEEYYASIIEKQEIF